MLVYKDDDGNIYVNESNIPIVDTVDNSKEITDLKHEIELLNLEYERLMNEANVVDDKIKNLTESLNHHNRLHNTNIRKATTKINMSRLKILSKLGYKHIVMPDVFILKENFELNPPIPGVQPYYHSDIIGKIHGKTIIYERKPIFTNSLYKNGRLIQGRELKWICAITYIERNHKYFYNIYLDNNKIRFGDPGNPMKKYEIKNCLNGLFHIDRTLDYNQIKQMILTEMTKQLLKGE